jgi:hypothetical protein
MFNDLVRIGWSPFFDLGKEGSKSSGNDDALGLYE